ncbi:MAG TPA: MBL fold metallo-hydrolase, partial [Holophagaceae bacterium]|nr:MBL fold metallo-hydrolase [Holophagaceae bacterium]
MRYLSLASGSKGNCHAFSDGGRTVLIDAGLNLKQLRLRCEATGLDYASIGAVALTHEHSDHIGAVGVMLRRTDWAFAMTPATKRAVEAIHGIEIPDARWLRAEAGHALDWDGWELRPFSLPHDAEDPVAWRVEANGYAMAVVTDL